MTICGSWLPPKLHSRLQELGQWPTIIAWTLEWDEAKSERCYMERGFDFAYAAHVFLDPQRLIQADTRHSYGEDRYQCLGKIAGRLFFVAFTPRNGLVRIVSARKANRREIKHYDSQTHDTQSH